MNEPGKPEKRKRDFYDENRGNAVNLFAREGIIHCGDLDYCDRNEGEVILKNYLCRRYNPDDGSCRFIESQGTLEIKMYSIVGKEVTTREDRLGRIADLNKDRVVVEAEKEKRLKELQNQITNNQS